MSAEIFNIVPLRPTPEFFSGLEPSDQSLVIAYRAIGDLVERPLTSRRVSLLVDLYNFTSSRQFNPPADREEEPTVIAN